MTRPVDRGWGERSRTYLHEAVVGGAAVEAALREVNDTEAAHDRRVLRTDDDLLVADDDVPYVPQHRGLDGVAQPVDHHPDTARVERDLFITVDHQNVDLLTVID